MFGQLTRISIAAALVLPLAALARAQVTDCASAASRVVSQTGGQLLSATPSNNGDQIVCVVTVLVQGDGNARPKKVTVSVPQ